MESEELNLVQLFKNLHKRKELLLRILCIVTIIALLYTLVTEIWIRKSSAVVMIDKNDSTIEDVVANLNKLDVEAKFDKNKKTITFESKGLNRIASEYKIKLHLDLVKDNLTKIYDLNTFKITQDIKTEKVSISKILKNILLFEVIGAVIYLGYIFIITSWATTTDEYELSKLIKLKVLGKINNEENTDSDLTIEEELEIIKANIELNKDIKSPKTIMFVGANKQVGTTYVLTLLQEAYKKDNKKVDIISSSSFEDINKLLNELKEKNDIVLIDGNIINNSHKTIILSNLVDANIIVALAEKTKTQEIVKTKQYIENVNGKISGIILNKI